MAIAIVATVKVLSGKDKEFEAVFADLTAKVRANEPGCQLYQLCRSKSDPSTYIAMELYADDEAVKVHGSSSYFAEAGAKMAGCVAGPPDIQMYDTVG